MSISQCLRDAKRVSAMCAIPCCVVLTCAWQGSLRHSGQQESARARTHTHTHPHPHTHTHHWQLKKAPADFQSALKLGFWWASQHSPFSICFLFTSVFTKCLAGELTSPSGIFWSKAEPVEAYTWRLISKHALGGKVGSWNSLWVKERLSHVCFQIQIYHVQDKVWNSLFFLKAHI